MEITTEVTVTRGAIVDRSTVIIDAEGFDNREVVIGNGLTNVEVALAFAFADLLLVYITSDQDVLLETNDGTTPDDSFSLTAGQEMFWRSGSGVVCPFTANVTAFFFSNAGAVDANVVIRIGSDATP